MARRLLLARRTACVDQRLAHVVPFWCRAGCDSTRSMVSAFGGVLKFSSPERDFVLHGETGDLAFRILHHDGSGSAKKKAGQAGRGPGWLSTAVEPDFATRTPSMMRGIRPAQHHQQRGSCRRRLGSQ